MKLGLVGKNQGSLQLYMTQPIDEISLEHAMENRINLIIRMYFAKSGKTVGVGGMKKSISKVS